MTSLTYAYQPTAPGIDHDIEEDMMVHCVDFGAMVSLTDLIYYGGKSASRKEGTSHFFGHNLDEEGHMTEYTPAVIWVEQDSEAVAQYHRVAEPAGLTFPQYVEELYNSQREADGILESDRLTKLTDNIESAKRGSLKTSRGTVVNDILAAYFGSSEVADAVASSIVYTLTRHAQASVIGPGRDKAPVKLFGTSPAQALAQVLGFADYNVNGMTGDKKLSAAKITLPVAESFGDRFTSQHGEEIATSCIRVGSTKAAKTRPLATGSAATDPQIMGQLVHIVKNAMVQYIVGLAAAYKHNSKVAANGGDRDEYLFPKVVATLGERVAAELELAILKPGLSDWYLEQLNKAEGKQSAVVRDSSAAYFWGTLVGTQLVGHGTFGGLFPSLPVLCADVIRLSLVHPESFSGSLAGSDVPRIVPTQVTVEGESYLDGKQAPPTFFNIDLLELPADMWDKVSEAGAQHIAALPVWGSRQFFPPLPMAGECGGSIYATPSRRRSNAVVKHSRAGTPQASAADTLGARGLVCVELMQKTADMPQAWLDADVDQGLDAADELFS